MGCGCGGSSGLLLKGAGRQVATKSTPMGRQAPLGDRQVGGGCPCALGSMGGGSLKGGYRATKRNLMYLRKWKRGQSIGFTMRSSLKAKGLIPRANGTRRVSAKYMKHRGTRRRR
jgi:hypothetical protein